MNFPKNPGRGVGFAVSSFTRPPLLENFFEQNKSPHGWNGTPPGGTKVFGSLVWGENRFPGGVGGDPQASAGAKGPLFFCLRAPPLDI